METRLPIIIQTVLFRKKDGHVEFLLLKRNAERGGFWNAVNGTMEKDENVEQCQRRELLEETGVDRVVKCSEELYRFTFDYKNKVMTVLVFAAEVDSDVVIKINEEHTEYQWFSFEEAMDKLEFEEDKKALETCKEHIIK